MYVPDNLDPELKDILYECWKSTEMFCKTFMPATFTYPFSSFHREVFKALDNDKIQKLVIGASRGWGKTSIFNKAYPAKKIIYRDKHYIIPISATGPAAKEFSENLKNELLTNDEIVEIFGAIDSRSLTDTKGGFSTLEWVTSTGIKVMPRGAGQQIRGRQWMNYRPDLYIGDDLEDDEAVESEERRGKLKRWFFSAVKNSVDISSKDWRIIVVGTILHEDSLLANLLDENKHTDWVKIRLEICDDKLHSTWPERHSDEEIKQLYLEYKENDMLDLFYREFRNIPIAIEEQGFKPEYFKNYTESEQELNNNPDIESVVLCDPAKTLTKGSCNTAIVGVSVNTRTNELFVRDVVEEKLYPDELYDQMFSMAARINALVIAPLVTSLNEYIMYPIRNEMARRGLFYVIVEVKERQGKTGAKRSGGLVPMYRQGLVKHNATACASLERYLLQWPRPSKWDVIDAFAGIIYALEEGERYFSPLETGGDIEEEFKELNSEPALRLISRV